MWDFMGSGCFPSPLASKLQYKVGVNIQKLSHSSFKGNALQKKERSTFR